MNSIAAEPYPFEFRPNWAALLIIDMQRDFLEPGGFGGVLGNDVVAACAATIELEPADLLAACPRCRIRGGAAHARGPQARSRRSAAGQESSRTERDQHRRRGADGSYPGARRAGPRHHSRTRIPPPVNTVIDKPGKGAFFATDLHAILQNSGITSAGGDRRHHRGFQCQHDRPRGQRSRLRLLRAGGLRRDPMARVPQEVGLKMIKAQGGIFGWAGHQRGTQIAGTETVTLPEQGAARMSATTSC